MEKNASNNSGKPENGQNKVSTEPYKGVRDFYPRDKFIHSYILDTMSGVAESFGYQAYDASILEPLELYASKSGEEIVNEQTYKFTDRGDRDVTLRPEMTPTVARMVAAKRRELSFPLRWYSIPNVFRYERPQRGRLREHWQLNCDIFGVSGIEAEVEIIMLAYRIMKAFGANDSDFSIRIFSREVLNLWAKEGLGLTPEQTFRFTKVLDRVGKMSNEDFRKKMFEIVGDDGKVDQVMEFLTSPDFKKVLDETIYTSEENKQVLAIFDKLKALGVPESTLKYDPTLARGFDYYTGVVFEVFDTSPENNRSLFGGGRYDNLLEIFDAEPVPTVGFGMGDVTMQNFLETHNLLPDYTSRTDLYITTVGTDVIPGAMQLAEELREHDISVAVNVLDKKLGDQFKHAEKNAIPFALIVGENELQSNTFKLKHLPTGEEKEVKREDIPMALFEFGT